MKRKKNLNDSEEILNRPKRKSKYGLNVQPEITNKNAQELANLNYKKKN
jgi:hypothetical protein